MAKTITSLGGKIGIDTISSVYAGNHIFNRDTYKIRRYMRYIILLTCIAIGMSSCIRIPILSRPNKPQTHYNWTETESRKPKAVVTKNQIVVVEDVERSISATLDKTEPKLTFTQKIGRWISGLSFLWFIILIVSPPTAMSIFWWVIKKIKETKTALKETVEAIEASGMVKEENGLHEALKMKQSKKTRKLVEKLRGKI